ncbi:MAG: hypothetical protein JWO12_2874 [Frankiales bacterium]|nr:hypothetical protein [Frankiales bacterium]
MNDRVLPLVSAAVTLLVMLDLLRRRRLREKYAVLWLVVSGFVALFALLPGTLTALSRAVGVKTPVNLLFFSAVLVLLVVCVQLSYEISRLEDETRCLAEELGILRLDVQDIRRAPPAL